MYDQLEILSMARGLARHAAARHQVIAENLAQSDTPGYRARDVAPFAEAYRTPAGLHLRSTRPGHIPDSQPPAALRAEVERGVDGDPNGNTVSVEGQIVKSAEVQLQHDMALSIYRTTLGIMRATLGRG